MSVHEQYSPAQSHFPSTQLHARDRKRNLDFSSRRRCEPSVRLKSLLDKPPYRDADRAASVNFRQRGSPLIEVRLGLPRNRKADRQARMAILGETQVTLDR